MSKDCLRRETNAIFSTLRSRSNFFRNDSSKRKRFHLSAKKLHDKCSASVSVELQQGSYEKLNVGIFLQDYLQRNASQVPNMMCLWKMITVLRSLILNLLSPHYVTCFLIPTFAKSFKHLRRKELCKLEKYTFLWFNPNLGELFRGSFWGRGGGGGGKITLPPV